MISKLSSYLGPASLFSGSSAPSLVLYLDAGNTFSYTGTGGTWYDLTSLNNDIELSNTTFNATYSNLTNFKGSFEFGGTNSFGSLITGTAIPLMDSHYTIEAWIQANSYGIYENGGIIGWGNYGSIGEVNVLRQYGSGFANYWWGSDLTVSATNSTDYWYHLASTYDGTNRTIYLNGEVLGTDTPGLSHSVPYFNNLTVGVSNASEFFNGRISTIKVWNKNLNSSQLLSAFNSNKSKYGYDFGSMTFNDTQSAYLISNSIDYAFGTNDFTVEAFFKSSTSSHNFAGIVSLRDNNTYNDGVNINLTSADTVTPLIEFSAGGNFLTYTASIDEWYHVSISRTGATSSLFVNGNLINEVTDTLSYGNNDLVVGRYYTEYNGHYFNGLISNVRVLNGTGLYTSSFTPPSTPLSVTGSNTKLLISSQEMNPTADLTGLHSVTASNIGWTSSLPSLYVTNGLICYLDNYTGGSTWYDLSGNGNNATLYNGYSYNSTNGGVIRFDGVGILSNLGSSSRGEINLDLTTTPCTIMYGTRYLQNTPGYIPSGRSLGGKNNNWLLGTWDNSVNQFFIDSGGWIYGSTPDLSDMDWHIYTGTVNGPVKFWNNGTKLAENSPNGDGPNGIVLGSGFSEASNCDISFVLVYNRVLSDSEIELNFNNFRGRLGL
jgi:hypothetical protein